MHLHASKPLVQHSLCCEPFSSAFHLHLPSSMELTWLTVISAVLFLFSSLSFLWKAVDRWRHHNCYLLDYVCFKPSDDCKLSSAMCSEVVIRNKRLGLDDYRFLLKMVVNSGLSEETYGPRSIIQGREESPTHDDALEEADDNAFSMLDDLFRRTGVAPSAVDIVVLTVSMFAPSPSFTSRIVNRYKMRDDVKTFNLSGMGCSTSPLAVNLIDRAFRSRKRALALVVAFESMAPNWYSGTNRSMMLGNCLFRSGGCALLLTNDPAAARRSKLRLKCVVQTNIGAIDEAYGCAVQQEDDDGFVGMYLSKGLPKAAMVALSRNLRTLAPKVLPVSEMLLFVARELRYRLSPRPKEGKSTAAARVNFKTGIDHFCIHSGGIAVIEGVGNALGLTESDIEPAMMTLHRWGNTSVASLWYVLGYMEAKRRLRRGDRVLMIGVGAGFMSNSCVWEVVRDLDDGGAWADCADEYPPETLLNPFKDQFGWINEDDVFIKTVKPYLESVNQLQQMERVYAAQARGQFADYVFD